MSVAVVILELKGGCRPFKLSLSSLYNSSNTTRDLQALNVKNINGKTPPPSLSKMRIIIFLRTVLGMQKYGDHHHRPPQSKPLGGSVRPRSEKKVTRERLQITISGATRCANRYPFTFEGTGRPRPLCRLAGIVIVRYGCFARNSPTLASYHRVGRNTGSARGWRRVLA